MSATHRIKAQNNNSLELTEGPLGLHVLADSPASLTQTGVMLGEGERIALAFAAIGGGTIDHSERAKGMLKTLNDAEEGLTDEDLTVVARRALRLLANRRKARVVEEKHAEAIIKVARAAGILMGSMAATLLAKGGVRATA